MNTRTKRSIVISATRPLCFAINCDSSDRRRTTWVLVFSPVEIRLRVVVAKETVHVSFAGRAVLTRLHDVGNFLFGESRGAENRSNALSVVEIQRFVITKETIFPPFVNIAVLIQLHEVGNFFFGDRRGVENRSNTSSLVSPQRYRRGIVAFSVH